VEQVRALARILGPFRRQLDHIVVTHRFPPPWTVEDIGAEPIAEAAASKRLPTVYGYREHVDVGGSISYGADLNWCAHRTAYYVGRILKGAKPSDLPIEFPTNIERVINLKTAKALGLTVPSSLLVRAEEVIE
jgi:putative ABC transport system substrate-binding protein